MLVKCRRTESKRPVKQKDGTTAWLHIVADLGAPVIASKLKPRQIKKLTRSEIEALLKKFKQCLTTKRLESIAAELQVKADWLSAYEIGYDPDTECFTAPMYDGQRRLIGIHLRAMKNSQLDRAGYGKMSVKGSSNGLFIPVDYDDSPIPEGVTDDPSPLLLLTPEGLSDCAAIRGFGYRAIGRPSNTGGIGYLIDLLSRPGASKQDVIVMGEREDTKYHEKTGVPFWPGIEGNLSICQQLLAANCCSRVRFFLPPIAKGKDFREWACTNHAPTMEVLAGIVESPTVTPAWLRAATKRLEKRRIEERKKPAA